MEFCSCSLLLKFGFFESSFSSELFQLFPNLLVFGLNMLQVAFPGIEVMLVFSAIVSSVVLLYYFGLFVEEFALFVFHFRLFLIHELATADVSAPDSLNL